VVATELYDRLVKSQGDLTKKVLVIDCGHFDSVIGVDDFSLNTTDLAIDIFNNAERERRNGLKIVFSVLIDDVGVLCNEDAMICIPKDLADAAPPPSGVPSQILEKLSETVGYRENRVKLFSEKTARNRGIQFFRKRVKAGAIDAPFFIKNNQLSKKDQLLCRLVDGNEVLMADMNDAIWSGHCPLLMGMHYRDIAHWASGLFPNKTDVEIIDFSLNSDKGKVNAGAQVALGSMNRSKMALRITNVCFPDEDVDLYTLNTYGELAYNDIS